jgi:hypothetical protein
VVLAALHDLVLAGRVPALAAAYGASDVEAAAAAATDALVGMTDAVAAVAARRPPGSWQSQVCCVLSPAVAEVAYRVGADAVGLVDLVRSPGLNLHLDRVGVTYDDGQRLGDPASLVQLSASVVGGRPVPARPMPEVRARVGVGSEPFDVTGTDEVRWLRAWVWPDQHEQLVRLEAELALAATASPVLLRGDAVELLADAVSRVPAGALPVVTSTWALSQLSPQSRLRFLHRLEKVAAGRTVAWVSVEGVGVAPAVPTFGDRPASGHSIIGLAVLEHTSLRVEAVGRCWSRGRLLAWLA